MVYIDSILCPFFLTGQSSISLCFCILAQYIHIMESTWKILQTHLKKEMVVFAIPGKNYVHQHNKTMDTPDSEMIVTEEGNGCRLGARIENWMTTWPERLVHCCQLTLKKLVSPCPSLNYRPHCLSLNLN